MTAGPGTGVDLYWLPLGAGGHSVRLNGRLYEAVAAQLERRPPCDLYHAALEVRVPEGRFVIEQAPVRDRNGRERGVVAEGAVGSRWAGRFRIFRYEVRRWRGGVIPDVAEAVESPRRLTEDPAVARRVLELVPRVPTPVWGRDELRAGEMWNSNSVIAWLLICSGLATESVHPPAGGRAPGWRTGLVVARRTAEKPQSDSASARMARSGLATTMSSKREDMMKKILIATDGSPSAREAVTFGLEIAAEQGAEVVFVRVIPTADVLPINGFGLPAALPHRESAADRTPLEEAARLAAEQGITAHTELLRGTAVDEIVAYADSLDAGLIVVGSRAHGAVASALIGSVSQGILHEARRPVLVVRGARPREGRLAATA